MDPFESHDSSPASPDVGPAERRPAWRTFAVLALAITVLGIIFVIRQGRLESIEEITYPQFLEKLRSGEIDRKAGVVLISKPGAMESVEAHLLNPPTAKVRAPVALQDDRHLKTDLETQYGVVVTEKTEGNLRWAR